MPPEQLSLAEARRIALAAQGFGGPTPGRPGMRHVQAELDRLALFQIDSVNVVKRAHYLPLFSRLGAYDPALLDRTYSSPPRRAFEYWGHAASLIDVTLQPALRHRMQGAADEAWGSMVRVQREQPGLVERVYAEIAASPAGLTAREIEHDEVVDRSYWGWNWSAVKAALEWLFWSGRVTSAGRTAAFERIYSLPERVLPPEILALPTPEPQEAMRQLIRRAARALGVAGERSLADYFRTPVAATRLAVADLVDSGELLEVRLGDSPRRTWLWAAAARPRRLRTSALVGPFDSLVFERRRVAELFGIDHRLEFYVPAPQRKFGYLVFLFLLDEEFVARVDLKADRKAGSLIVQSSWYEESASLPVGPVAGRLVPELRRLAGWLGLDSVTVKPLGTLSGQLAAAVARADL